MSGGLPSFHPFARELHSSTQRSDLGGKDVPGQLDCNRTRRFQ
jgi:hypothetical protein